MRIKSPGHVLFAGAMIAIGILSLVTHKFTPVWSGIPKAFPAREVVLYATALVSLLSGIGLLWQRTALAAARVLLVAFLLWLVLVRLVQWIQTPAAVDAWWACGDTAVMVGAVWTLSGRGLRIGRVFYGLGLIPFGLAHFLYLKETAVLVPHYLGFPTFWAYFTGAAFIAAGIANVTGIFARLGAVLIAWQFGLLTLLVWIPIVVAGHPTPFQWNEFVSSCVLTATAWLVADLQRLSASTSATTSFSMASPNSRLISTIQP